MNIHDDPIYKEETIREKARLDEVERRKNLEKELKKKENKKKSVIYTIVIIGAFIIFLFLTMPFFQMYK